VFFIPLNKTLGQEITENEYATFFNEILEPDSLILEKEIKNSDIKFEHFKHYLNTYRNNLDIKLSSEDLDFIRHQLENEKKIKTSDINRKSIDQDLLDSIFNNNNDLNTSWDILHQIGEGYYELTLPFFTKDKSLSFFSFQYYCDSLCGSLVGLRVYKIIKGKWEYYGDLLPIRRS